MAFQKGNTFVFGETPSASKWDQLWRNDDALADGSGFDEGAIDTDTLAESAVTAPKLDPDSGFVFLGETTLGSAGDTISVQNLPARKYLQIWVKLLNSGSINAHLRFNNDSGNNYSYRSSINGAADATATSQAGGQVLSSNSASAFAVIEVENTAAQEKYSISSCVYAASGAGSAPSRLEGHIKWANTSDPITRVDIVNESTGDYASGSQVVVYGSID